MIGSSAVTNKSVIAQTKRRREKKMEQNHKKSHREKWKAGGGGRHSRFIRRNPQQIFEFTAANLRDEIGVSLPSPNGDAIFYSS